jgi:hypothetical protein
MRILAFLPDLESPSLIEEENYEPEYLQFLFLEQIFSRNYLEDKIKSKELQV